MSDADLGRAVEEIFETECNRMQRDVLTALTPGDPVFSMSHERLIMHHHASICVLSQIIADMIDAVPDETMRRHLRTAVLTVVTPDPRSKELH